MPVTAPSLAPVYPARNAGGRPFTAETLWGIPRVGAPQPAPDGTWAVVPVTTYDLEKNEGKSRLWMVSANGAFEPRPLTSPETTSTAPRVSPDGTRVAFVRVTVDEKKDQYDTSIWIARTDGSEPARQLTGWLRDATPRWSPDGTRLAFQRVVDKDNRPQPPQIYVMTMAGGEARAVTEIPRGAGNPVWSPDGKTSAFSSSVFSCEPGFSSPLGASVSKPKMPGRSPVTSYASDFSGRPSGPVTDVYDALRAAAGDLDIWVVGGGDLAGQFADAGLLDDIVVSVAPVTLGAGRPLLPRRLDLRLVETAPNGAFVTARYEVDGPLLEDRAG